MCTARLSACICRASSASGCAAPSRTPLTCSAARTVSVASAIADAHYASALPGDRRVAAHEHRDRLGVQVRGIELHGVLVASAGAVTGDQVRSAPGEIAVVARHGLRGEQVPGGGVDLDP